MKKTFQIFLVMALVTGFMTVHTAQSQINYGLKGGLNIANVGGSDIENTDPRTGFHVGGFLELSLLGIIAAEGGVYYSEKGYSLSDDIEAVSSYIDVPLVAKFGPIPFIHFFAGPQFSFLLDNKMKIGDKEDSATDGMREMDIAAVLGAGVNIPGGLRASIGYDIGLTSLDEDGDINIFNRVLKITVGYRF